LFVIVLKSIETWSRLKNLRLNRSYSILLFSPFAQIFELDLIIMAKKAYSIKFSEDLAVVNLEKINPRRSRREPLRSVPTNLLKITIASFL